MKIVDFKRPPDAAALQQVLDVVDKLRAALVEGRITGFAAVSINDEDDLESWTGTIKPISPVRMQGAVAHLSHCMHTGDA